MARSASSARKRAAGTERLRCDAAASWTGQRRARLSASAQAKTRFKASGGLSLDRVLDVEWEIVLGEAGLTPKELRALAQLKAPLVRVRGQWVQLSAAEIQAALTCRSGAGRRSPAVTCYVWRSAPTPSRGWRSAASTPTDRWANCWPGWPRVIASPPCPTTSLTATLRPYQTRGYAWLEFLTRWGLGACLADDMGLGKTVQTLALFATAAEAGETRPALLICPTSCGQLAQGKPRASPRNCRLWFITGPGRDKGDAFAEQARLSSHVLSSYGCCTGIYPRSKAWNGGMIWTRPEHQERRAKQARAAPRLRAERRIALTGTPVENKHRRSLVDPGIFSIPASSATPPGSSGSFSSRCRCSATRPHGTLAAPDGPSCCAAQDRPCHHPGCRTSWR